MIGRAHEVLAGEDPGLALETPEAADALVDGVEEALRDVPAHAGAWHAASALSAIFASASGAYGVWTLAHVLRPELAEGWLLLPLGGIPLGLAALAVQARSAAGTRALRSEAVWRRLRDAGVAPDRAQAVAAYVAGATPAPSPAPAAGPVPGSRTLALASAAAAWGVISFWVLYAFILAESAVGRGGFGE